MSTIRPQANILKVWRIMLVIGAVPPAFLCSLLLEPGSKWWLLASAIWITAFLGAYLFYLPARYSAFSFHLADNTLYLSYGVFFRRKSALPVSSVQFTSLVANPVQSLFGLCSLMVVAPGARAFIPGLLRKDAEALAKLLTGRQSE